MEVENERLMRTAHAHKTRKRNKIESSTEKGMTLKNSVCACAEKPMRD